MVLRTHLGAGDGIIQSGMAVALLDTLAIGEQLWFPCYPQYEATFKSIFVHHPRIRVFTVEERFGETWGSPKETTYDHAQLRCGCGINGEKLLRCGVYKDGGCWEDFTKQFYAHAGIPYEARWDRCPVAEAARSFNAAQANRINFVWPAGKRRIFVHDDPRRSYRIWKRVQTSEQRCIFKPHPDHVTISILAYVPLIESADEIHVIDSAFFHLIDSVAPLGAVYLHRYARWPRSRLFRFHSRLAWDYID